MDKKLRLNERLRLIFQAISFAFHNGYLKGWSEGKIYSGVNKTYCMPGLNCYSCPGAVGACPIGSLQAVLDSGSQKYSLYVLGFIGLMGVTFGRLICGWMCPFGLVQDLLYKIPLFRKIKNLPGHKVFKYLRFVILALFVIILPMVIVNKVGVGSPWFCEYICPSGMLFGGIPLVVANPDMRGSIGLRFYWKLFILLAVLILSIKAYRPFCKYICPLGALYGCGNKVSLYRLNVDMEKCVRCGACQNVCGMDIKVWEDPNSMDCIRCGKCKSVCPKGAITSTMDSIIGKTGFTKKHKKLIEEDTLLDSNIFMKYATIAALMLIVSGAGVALYAFVNRFLPLAVEGLFEDKDNFIVYILGLCGPILPSLFNIAFGIKILIDRKKTDQAENLTECTVMAGKYTLLVIIITLIYSICIASGTSIVANAIQIVAYGGEAYVMYGGILAPLFAVAAYFVMKAGINKAKIHDSLQYK